MTALDWLIVAIVVISVALAAAQGFFFEIFSLAGVVVGYLLAAWGYHYVAAWYHPYVKSPWIGDLAGFLTVFVAVVILAALIARLVRHFVKQAGLSWIDRLLGAAFGLLRGLLIVTVLVLAMASFTPGSRLLARSELGSYLLIAARGASWLAPSGVRHQFRRGVEALRNLRPAGNPGAQPVADR
jgi:membrane protein required for colicin V production